MIFFFFQFEEQMNRKRARESSDLRTSRDMFRKFFQDARKRKSFHETMPRI